MSLSPAPFTCLIAAALLSTCVALPASEGDADAKAQLEYRPDIDEAAMKELEARLQREYDGARASGKLSGPVTYGKNARGKKGNAATNPADRTEQIQKGMQMIKQYDKDGDGLLNETERRDMGVAILTRMRDDPSAQAEYIKKWDTNEDGDLSISEEAAAKEAMDKFHAHMEKINERVTKRFDADGDGQLNADERVAAKAGMEKFRQKIEEGRTKILKRYDADGDGQLSEAEKQKIQADWGKRRRTGKRGL